MELTLLHLGAAVAVGLAAAACGAALAAWVKRAFSARLSSGRFQLACGGAAGLAALASPPGAQAVVSGVLALVLLLLAAVDLAVMRLPDALTLPLAATGLLRAAALHDDLGGKAIGGVAGFLVLAAIAQGYLRLRRRPGLGLGDAKLFAAAGAWLGWGVLPQLLLVACGFGFAGLALAVARTGFDALRRPFPFGPALCGGFLVTWLWMQAN